MERFGRTWLFAFLVIGIASAAPLYGQAVRPESSGSGWKQVTRASWYGREFRGQRTAAGNKFNPQLLSAAHRTLKLGSTVKVTELRSGRSVVVRITDRGPYLHGRGIDLSYAAARELGIVQRGVAKVRVELVRPEEATTPPAPTLASLYGSSGPWLSRAVVE